MSSNITTAFDAIKTKMNTTFPLGSGYYQITNPYLLSDNTESSKAKGWGIAVKSGLNTRKQISCYLTMSRNIDIVLVRMSNGSDLLTSNKELATKALLEDQFTLIQSLEQEPTLNNATSNIIKFEYDSDTGIEFIESGMESFFVINTTFSLEYFETL